jgi:hypothetical protein
MTMIVIIVIFGNHRPQGVAVGASAFPWSDLIPQ